MNIRKPADLTEWLTWLGVLSFIPALFYYIVGEEGIYVISTMETWHQHNWVQQFMYGRDNARPPLLNWFTTPFAALIGWKHTVVAVRAVTIASSLGMVAWLYWLGRRLFDDRQFALFAALACLCMADLALYRGWLTYTDPIFSFFTFGAMAALWTGVAKQRRNWIMVSAVLLVGAVLAKALTAVVFYGTVGFVLLWQRDTRRFLFTPRTLLALALGPALLMLWFFFQHGGGTAGGMLSEMMSKLSGQNLSAYLGGLLAFPLDVAFRLSPVVLLAVYLLLRKRVTLTETAPANARAAFWIALLCFLPYWLSPQNSVRYLMPIYPAIALVGARFIWRSGESGRTLALRWFGGFLAFKLVLMLAVFPWYQTHYRGANYAETAQRIIQRTQGFPLYVNDVRSIGLSITGYVDMERFPQAPLTYPPVDFDSGYIISMTNDPAIGKLVQTYTLAADSTFLLCRGTACIASGITSKATDKM